MNESMEDRFVAEIRRVFKLDERVELTVQPTRRLGLSPSFRDWLSTEVPVTDDKFPHMLGVSACLANNQNMWKCSYPAGRDADSFVISSSLKDALEECYSKSKQRVKTAENELDRASNAKYKLQALMGKLFPSDVPVSEG